MGAGVFKPWFSCYVPHALCSYVVARHLVLLKHQALRKALFSMRVGNLVRRCQTSPPCARAFAQSAADRCGALLNAGLLMPSGAWLRRCQTSPPCAQAARRRPPQALAHLLKASGSRKLGQAFTDVALFPGRLLYQREGCVACFDNQKVRVA